MIGLHCRPAHMLVVNPIGPEQSEPLYPEGFIGFRDVKDLGGPIPTDPYRAPSEE